MRCHIHTVPTLPVSWTSSILEEGGGGRNGANDGVLPYSAIPIMRNDFVLRLDYTLPKSGGAVAINRTS